MKKLLSLLLVCTMLLGLIGCGSNNNAGGNTDNNSGSGDTAKDPHDEPYEIDFWIYPMYQGLNGEADGEFDDWAKDRVAQFNEKYPNVKVNIEMLNWQNSLEKIDVAVMGGQAPDIVYTINSFGGVIKYGKMGALEPIDDYLTQEDWDDWAPAVQGAIGYDGKTYMWPWLKLVSGVAVNTDLVKERGAEALFPFDRELRDWTYDEFLAAAQALTFSRSGSDDPDVYGYSMWGKDSAFYNYLFGVANGTNVLNEGMTEYTFNTPEAAEGLQFAADLANKYQVTPQGAAGIDYQQVHDMFLQQQVAMIPYTSDIVTEAKNAEVPFNVDFVAPPHGEDGELTAWNNVGGFIVFKQEDEVKRDLVMEFARLCTNAENSKIHKLGGSYPARDSSGNIYPEDDALAQFMGKLSAYGNSNFSLGYGLVDVKTWEAAFQSLLLGDSTPEEVLETIGVAMEESLAK